MPTYLNEVNTTKTAESFGQEKFETVKPDRSKYLWMLGIVLTVLAGVWFLMNPNITMVDMTGWTVSDATTWAEKNGIQLVSSGSYSDTIDADIILAQSAAAQSKLSKNATVQVTVSLGADPDALITLPTFDETWTKTRILTWLNEQKIENYSFSTELDSTRDANLFISVSTPDTSLTEFTRKDSIEFVLSATEEISEVTVADFSTYSQTQLASWFSTNGLNLTLVEAFSDSVDEGKVVSQSVPSETVVASGSTITVTISKGKAVIMADFTQLTQAAAQAWASDNGIQLSFLTQYSTIVKGKSIRQSIAKNTAVAQATKVTVTYSLGNQVALPSYSNQTLLSLQNYVDQQNALGASLTLNVSYQASQKVGLNKVIAQSVYDTTVAMNASIDVIVSDGKRILVPDFSTFVSENPDQTYQNIINACESTGITCRILKVTEVPENIGKIISQSVPADTYIGEGTILDIKIGF